MLGAVAMRSRTQRGMTLVELIAAFTILALLTSMSVPLTRYKVRRDKERDLRVALREIRRAIDMYKDAAAGGSFQVKVGTEGYPETLEMLVEGVVMSGAADGGGSRHVERARQPRPSSANGRSQGSISTAPRARHASKASPSTGVPSHRQSMRNVSAGKPVTPAFMIGQLMPHTKVRVMRTIHWRVVNLCIWMVLS